MKDKEHYILKDGELIKLSKFKIFINNIKRFIHKYKIVNTYKYSLIPYSDRKYIFKLSKKEYEEAEKIYSSKGTISYEFYPCGGIGWGIRLHILESNEIIDITDIDSF